MHYHDLITQMPEDVYLRLKKASETGKWPDGQLLNAEQKEHCLQAVLAWQALNIADKQHLMPAQDGSLVQKDKRSLQNQFKERDDIIPTQLKERS